MKKTLSTVMNPESDRELLQLDLTGIIKKRAGRKGKIIPSFLLHRLEKIIKQDELNGMLRAAYPAEGSEFSSRILSHLGIEVEVKGLDALPDDGKYIFASNHPLGGLDGISLVAVLGSKYGDDNIRVMVNDLLMNVTPLSGVFLPVNKFGSKGGRESSLKLNEALKEGKQIVMFPAGLVSRLQPDGTVRDLAWKKSFVSKALEFHREIVPVKFEGANSGKFYKTAMWRKKLGLKINVEQVLLPSEVCKSEGKSFAVSFGTPIDVESLRASGSSISDIVERIYRTVYSI